MLFVQSSRCVLLHDPLLEEKCFLKKCTIHAKNEGPTEKCFLEKYRHTKNFRLKISPFFSQVLRSFQPSIHWTNTLITSQQGGTIFPALSPPAWRLAVNRPSHVEGGVDQALASKDIGMIPFQPPWCD